MTTTNRRDHLVLAARARRRMREETSEIARAIQLRIARRHEARVGYVSGALEAR